MSEVQQLFRLQEIDSEIRQKTERLGEVLKAQKESGELLSTRQRVVMAEEELADYRTQYTDLNLQLDSLNNKAKRSENRLYSGKVTNPKELTDLQHEINWLGRRREALEDVILDVMIGIEETEEEKSEAEVALADMEAEWQRSLASLRQQQNELALRIRALTAERKKQLSMIRPSTLAQYEKIRQQKGGLAVTYLKENICQGCRLNVSVNTVKSVNQGELILCENCGRILTRKW